MRLDRLLDHVEVTDVRGDPAGTEIRAVVHDSRRAIPDSLFCCVPGARSDGHDHAAEAVRSGSVAVLSERPVPVDVTTVIVPHARAAMAAVADRFFGHPSGDMNVVGVTGTNGKTTTTHLLAGALSAAGHRTEVLGTLSGERTTPEAPDFQEQLAGFRNGGVDTVAVEVSSHALVQHRIDGTEFAAAVFTNLSRDHLDFHGTVERYFDAKRRLFEPGRTALGVVNADDPYGREIIEHARIPIRPFSMADAEDLHVGLGGSRFVWLGARVQLALGGAANVSNALAAATVALELGASPSAIGEGLSSVTGVPGRFEKVDAGQPFTVLVDFAHTPAALEQVLLSARPDRGRLIVVFGCGGGRDRAKRPVMGRLATTLADVAVLTSDNPRHEDAGEIIAEVMAGVGRSDSLIVEPDRRAAIAAAVSMAEPDDVVVIAGKGHETVQIVGDRILPFDDRRVVREELAP